MEASFQILGAGFILVMGLMTLLFFVYLFRKNAGIVDIGWAISFLLITCLFGFLGTGLFSRRVLITLLVAIWSLRLAFHLTERYLHGPEDSRYVRLRREWGENSHFPFLMLYWFQGVLATLVSLPFFLICQNDRTWSILEWIGLLVWIVGVVGESVADAQLRNFKKARKGVCQSGLWGYSRHPNYFFEWVVWVGYFIMALPAPSGLLAIISPLLMYYLLTRVSGIPMAERESLESKGEAYRAYQKSTNAFFPMFSFRRLNNK